MYIGLRVKYRYCCQILMKLECSRQIFEEYSNIKFHENPSSGSRVVPCGPTDGQTNIYDETRVAFRNFAKSVYKQQALVYKFSHGIVNISQYVSSYLLAAM
jgi:hypothetical protein